MPKPRKARAAAGPRLSTRALNRALLARQHLLAPTTLSPQKLVAHLVGLQAQAPLAPYYGLWSRLERCPPSALSELLLDRRVVRVVMMRSTLHLVTAEDCLKLRPALQQVSERAYLGAWKRQLGDADLDAVAERGRALVEASPLTTQQLGEALHGTWPSATRQALANAVRAKVPLIQLPPRGLWGQGGLPTVTSAEAWLGRPLGPAASAETLFRRYLAAFGPASVNDAQKWSGLTGLREAAERLRKRLLTFEDEAGRELFDLPDAPRPDEDTPAPVRLVAEFDNLLLSHEDRSRIVGPEAWERIFTVNGIIPGTVLVDGFVQGKWALVRDRKEARVVLTPFRRWSAGTRAQAEHEADRLLDFAAGEAARRSVELER